MVRCEGMKIKAIQYVVSVFGGSYMAIESFFKYLFSTTLTKQRLWNQSFVITLVVGSEKAFLA